MESFRHRRRRYPGAAPAAVSVGDLCAHLAALIRGDALLQDVWVRGEVASCTQAASGHWYFSLKDPEGALACVMWRSAAWRLRFRLEPGVQVIAHGALELYPPRGQYQLVVDQLHPAGAGQRHQGMEELRARLQAEGLFDPSRKRPLPEFPAAIAVVTSLAGAAVRDICVTLRACRYPPEIVLVPVQVQGDAAPAAICEGLRLANERAGADLIILGRGGGAAEDLWCFNAEEVARAIAGSRLPVISAVGHESDFTLADLAADLRAATPTAAAERVAARREEMVRRMEAAGARSLALFRSRLENARLRWEALAYRARVFQPEWVVAGRRQRLDELDHRLERAARHCCAAWRQRLAVAAGKLEGLSPLATLARGYGVVTRRPGGEPVTAARDVRTGDAIRVRLRDGSLDARVTETGE